MYADSKESLKRIVEWLDATTKPDGKPTLNPGRKPVKTWRGWPALITTGAVGEAWFKVHSVIRTLPNSTGDPPCSGHAHGHAEPEPYGSIRARAGSVGGDVVAALKPASGWRPCCFADPIALIVTCFISSATASASAVCGSNCV